MTFEVRICMTSINYDNYIQLYNIYIYYMFDVV